VSTKAVALLLAVLAVVAGLLWIAARSLEKPGSGQAIERSAVRADPTGLLERSSDVSADAAAEPDPAAMLAIEPNSGNAAVAARNERSPEFKLRGRVVDAADQPLAGALVRWTPLRAEFERNWPLAVPWQAIEASSRTTVSGETGQFELTLEAADPLHALDSVIWASVAGYQPGYVLMSRARSAGGALVTDLVPDAAEESPSADAAQADAGRGALQGKVSGRGVPPGDSDAWTVRCARLEGQRVRVLDSNEAPAAAASVRLLGQARYLAVGALGAELARAVRVYSFEGAVDERGMALLPAFEHEVLYQARLGDQLSLPGRSKPGEVLELTLAGGLEFEARVLLEAGAELRPTDVVFVAHQQASGDWMSVGGFEIRSDGTCGPHVLPDLPGLQWEFQIQAERLLPDVVLLPRWRAGERARVELKGVKAEMQPVRVLELGEENPVSDAVVRARWFVDDTNQVMRYGSNMLTDAQGRAQVPAPGARPLWLSVARSGFSDAGSGPHIAGPDPIDVHLTRESTLRGRVQHSGVPVQDFRVTYWISDRMKCSYEDFQSSDGSFVMERMPRAVITLYAVGRGYAQCQPVQVDLRGREEGEVVLELPSSVRGRGLVLDANTRRPLGGVQVLVYTCEQFQMLTRSGVETLSGPDGRFELDGFAPSHSSIYCLKDGYAPQYAFAIGKPGEEIDFGILPLTSDDPYCMQLVPGAWPGLTVRSWAASGAATADGIVPDAAGWSCVRGVKPGLLMLTLAYSDRSTVEFDQAILPGKPLQWEHTIGGPAAATIELPGVGAPGCEVEPPFGLVVNYASPEGRPVRRVFMLGAEPRGRLEGLPPGPAVIAVYDAKRMLARRRVEFLAGAEQAIAIEIGCEQRCLQLITQTGEPYAGKYVFWSQPGEYHNSKQRLRTSADGEFCIPGEITGSIELTATESGFVVSQPVLLNAAREPRQIVQLAPVGELAVRLLDGDAPVPGILCMLQNEGAFFLQNAASTNQSGSVRWEQIALQPQRLTITGQGLWEQSVVLMPRPAPAPLIDVAVHRVGSLELRAISANGLPLAGATFELSHAAFAGSAADWLASGRITSSTGSLTSAPDGKLLLEGLPRGEYALRATLPGGASGSGACQVRAGEASACAILLP